MTKLIKVYMLLKDNIVDIYLFVFLLSSILLSRNTLISSCVLGFNKSFLFLLAISIPLFFIFINKFHKKEIQMKNSKIILVFILAIIFSIVFKIDFKLLNFSILTYLVTAFVFCMVADFRKVMKWYIYIIVSLSVFSLITTYLVKPYIFNSGLDENVKEIGLTIINSSGNRFLNLGLGFAFFQSTYIRNFGIFKEPSYFQFYIILAIIFLLFFRKVEKKDYAVILLLLGTLISTFSAAAFVVIPLILIIFIIKLITEKLASKKKIIISLISILLFFVIIVYTVPALSNNIKLVVEKLTTVNESSTSRIGSIIFAVENFMHSPIIGNKITPIMEYENYLTNTTFTIGSIYGIVPLTLQIYFIWKLSRKYNKNIVVTIGIFMIILLSSNSHVFLGVNSFWIIILFGFMKNKSSIFLLNENVGEKNENTLDS